MKKNLLELSNRLRSCVFIWRF